MILHHQECTYTQGLSHFGKFRIKLDFLMKIPFVALDKIPKVIIDAAKNFTWVKRHGERFFATITFIEKVVVTYRYISILGWIESHTAEFSREMAMFSSVLF